MHTRTYVRRKKNVVMKNKHTPVVTCVYQASETGCVGLEMMPGGGVTAGTKVDVAETSRGCRFKNMGNGSDG